jgi:hypothetical protein
VRRKPVLRRWLREGQGAPVSLTERLGPRFSRMVEVKEFLRDKKIIMK